MKPMQNLENCNMEEDREPEVWKPIPDYEGVYEVSSWGRVKSLERIVNMSFGRTRLLKERILSNKKTRGYFKIELYKNGKVLNYMINRLVCSQFIGEINGNVVNHKDRDAFNNYYKNLEIISQRENVAYSTINSNKTSRFIGVSFDKKKKKSPWVSNIFLNKKLKYLGAYYSEEEAHQAYLNALKEYGLTNKYANENQEKS